MSDMQKVIVLLGPTASGKTALSIELAKAVSGEIISADSRQVYRRLDIGTGKITPTEMRGVSHHLLDVANPQETFSAGEFVKRGRAAISEIAARGHVPLIVGGTGFYMDTLLGKISLADVPADITLRNELKTKKPEELLNFLETLDPEKAETIDKKNRVRLVRAIEIARALGAVPKSKEENIYDALWLGIKLTKEELNRNIGERLHTRMQGGMLEEAKRLHENGLSYERMEELGLEYRYLARHLSGKISYDEMLRELESEIRKYAKRQMTWFKRNKKIHWLTRNEKEKAIALMKKFLV